MIKGIIVNKLKIIPDERGDNAYDKKFRCNFFKIR